MKRLILIAGWFCISIAAKTQDNKAISSITFSGQIKDAVSGSGLGKATVHLKSTAPLKEYTAMSDSAGFFTIKDIIPKQYLLTIAYVGYTPVSKEFIWADSVHGLLPTKILLMEPVSRTLQNVVVISEKSIIENKPDRIVYNVDKDVTSQGGMATDILRKIPQVTVDINGNVELLGNPSVRFLINGKPSTAFGNSIADALQSIPASQIQSIEVMSSPGAKYDAAGTGGIINIILKKTKAKGFSGVVNITGGTRLENGSLNLNYKKNNLGITGYFSGSSQLKTLTVTHAERNATDTLTKNTYYLKQDGSSDLSRYGYRSGIGIDWDLAAKDNLSFSFGHNHFGNTNIGNTAQFNSAKDKYGNSLSSLSSNRNSDTRFNNYSFEGSVDYRRKLKKEKEELSFSYSYSAAKNNSSYLQSQQYLLTDSLFGGSQSRNPGRDHLSTLSADYTNPLSKNFLLELGVKTEIESLISNSTVYTFSPTPYQFIFDDKQTYSSTFKRQVYAGYISGSFSLFKSLNIIAGARLEHTVNKGTYSKSPGFSIPGYNNFGPALTISRSFKNNQTIKFSYAYRLERPEYRDLNPFVNLSDPHNISTGNPIIKPEIGNDFQLGYNQTFGKDNTLNIVLVYTYNSPDIKSFTTFYPSYKAGDSVYTDVNVTMRSNIAAETRWGINISSSITAISKLNIRANVQLYERTTKNLYSIPPVISGFEYRANLTINYQFEHGLIAEAFGNYNSGLRWQGRRAAFYSYTVAVRQQLFKGKGSFGFTAVNALGKYLVQKSSQSGSGFTGSSVLRIPYRSFGVSFMYKFGKIKISKPKEEENLLTKPPPGEN
jgi:ferric enterobactin receptor